MDFPQGPASDDRIRLVHGPFLPDLRLSSRIGPRDPTPYDELAARSDLIFNSMHNRLKEFADRVNNL